MTGNEHDARDAVQDAYLRAYRSIPRFRGDAAFSTWLHRIVANCAATQLAGCDRRQHQPLDTVTPADTEPAFVERRHDHDPEACSAQVADRDRLTAALSALPDRLRAVVVLRDIYDLPHEAIAAELGITAGAAKVRLHRARRQLRERLFPTAPEAHRPEQVARAG